MNYAEFRAKTWDERCELLGPMTPEEIADVVRMCIRGWLDLHRAELSTAQVAILEENIAFVTPELYQRPRSDEREARFKDLQTRTRALLSRRQICEALTQHWGN